MKKLMIVAAAAAGVALSTAGARADFGGPVMPASHQNAQAPYAAEAPCEKYGVLPMLKGCMWWKKDGSGHGKSGGRQMGPQGPPQAPGTLVFPYHWYVRSPRDFFMWEPGR